MKDGSTQVRIVTSRVKIASLKRAAGRSGWVEAKDLVAGHPGLEGGQGNPHG